VDETEPRMRGLIVFADGIWPLCTKVEGVPCPEPEKDCEDCEGPPPAPSPRPDDAAAPDVAR
jgi:hypothetical protein